MANESTNEIAEDNTEDIPMSDTSASAKGKENANQNTPESTFDGGDQTAVAGVDADVSDFSAVFQIGSEQFKMRLLDEEAVEIVQSLSETNLRVTEVMLATNGEKTEIGTPHIANAHVDIEFIDSVRSCKTISFKRRRRKHSSRTVKGHVQNKMLFRVVGISVPGFTPAL